MMTKRGVTTVLAIAVFLCVTVGAADAKGGEHGKTLILSCEDLANSSQLDGGPTEGGELLIGFEQRPLELACDTTTDSFCYPEGLGVPPPPCGFCAAYNQQCKAFCGWGCVQSFTCTSTQLSCHCLDGRSEACNYC